MIRFEVTGETPEEFAQNAMSAWGLLAIGLQQALSVSVPTTVAQPTNGSENSSTASKAADPAPTLVADRADDLFVENPKAGASEAPSAKPEAAAKPKGSSKGPKLDDLKTRLSEVIVAATERWDQKRANAYARKLLRQWEVEKLGDLPPADYAQFMLDAVPYVDGTAAE